jgi:transcriptional regulator with XRE-family HTH domain
VDFARAMGISANYVSLLAAGKKQRVSETLAKLIENTYGYRYEWVMTGVLPINKGDDSLHELQ